MGRIQKPRTSTIFLIAAAALIHVSCDDGIGLLTTDEKQSLYRAEVSGRGSQDAASARTQGVILDPAEGLRVVFETLRGSEEPAELLAVLKDASGSRAVSVRYHTPDAPDPSATFSQDKAVISLASLSQTLAVPGDFPDGYYELTLDARSARGESLSFTLLSLFLVRGIVPTPAILAYPANPAPGSRVLLVADLGAYPAGDPYLRWTVDGTVRSEGTVSEGRDKLLWPAPLAGQATPIVLALYPAAPPAGKAYSFPAPRGASAGLLVSPGAAATLDEFSDAGNFLALFRMEDTPDYEGRRKGSGSFLGAPRLDVHAGGFGLSLGGEAGAGVQADALLLPVQGGRLGPFSVLARLTPRSPASGILLAAVSAGAGPALEVALLEGRPSVALREGDRSVELQADALVSPGRSSFLAVSVFPGERVLRVLFAVDGKPAGEGTLPYGASGWPPEGRTVVAGPGGCPGLYDEVGVWAYNDRDEASAYPAFRYASLREFSSAVKIAEGFEGAPAGGLTLAGGARVSAMEGLRLPAGSSAVFDIPLDAPFRAEAALISGKGAYLRVEGPSGSARIPLDVSSGKVDPYSGLPLLSVRAESEGSGTETALRVLGAEGAVRIPGPGPWRLGLAGPDSGSSSVRFFRVVRADGMAGE